MNRIKSEVCPSNPISTDLRSITGIIRVYLDNPVLALAKWRIDNYTRISPKVLDTLPKIVQDKIAEMIEYFRMNGVSSIHILAPNTVLPMQKYIDARRSIVLVIGKRRDGKTNSIRTKRITHTPKHYHGIRDSALAYNRKNNAAQNMKQYDYKPR